LELGQSGIAEKIITTMTRHQIPKQVLSRLENSNPEANQMWFDSRGKTSDSHQRKRHHMKFKTTVKENLACSRG